ncbi:Mur ligase family protein [Varunaivibrio sulfuroxidans]|uniref:UDP-N-acetylmuramoylalanine--D-glutamate ligase n=1 Tax=Varunaivibrio sulfuroxidans TaxID=1773489 RepID=A0A4R3JBP4_9PROT|nr:hypothetical protein [Varunaivibrio sulfuroxidans]TCS63449.1 hypothetical protein EDD55_10370 [Varunaivibrio sulfuroxidans]WES30405.1 hypothetical protein P3M64_12295 [Varunaivibrio sulfuroxidans]
MINIFPFAGYPVAVLGLGRDGVGTARALTHSEAEVVAWDFDPRRRDEAVEMGIAVRDWTDGDLRQFTTVVSCPDIAVDPRATAVVARARAAGCEIISDIELLARSQRECGYIGVAGSNGSAFTSALIGHVLSVTGREAETIGLAPTCALDSEPLGMEGAYVLEMSPFRLEHTVSITFDIAVFLGDGEGGQDSDIKRLAPELFRRQTHPRAAVVVIDTPYGQMLHDTLADKNEQRVLAVSRNATLMRGVFVKDGALFDATEGDDPVPVVDLSALCADEHFGCVAAAFGAALAAGVKPYQAMAAINSFPDFDADAA